MGWRATVWEYDALDDGGRDGVVGMCLVAAGRHVTAVRDRGSFLPQTHPTFSTLSISADRVL